MSGARKLLLSGGALTVLLALVAIASRAHRPGGGTGGGGGSHVLSLLGPYVAAVGMVVLLVGTVLIVWALAYRRREQALAGQTSWRRTLLGLAAVLVLLSVATLASDRVQQARQRPRSELGAPLRAATTGQRERERVREATRARNEETPWLPLVVVGSIALGILLTTGAAIVHRRRNREVLDEEARLARALDDVLADTLDDLRAERDPRKAVIRAYARMEQTFAAYRVPREAAETPLEYVARVLDRLHVSGFAVRRLTQLFERAKFSTHAIDAATKEEAIEVLVGLRAELEHDREEAAAAA